MRSLSAFAVAFVLALTAQAASAGAPAAAAPTAASAPTAMPAAGDLKRGRLLYIQCRACHELRAGEPHKVGPNLAGLMGRKVAGAEGFAYSAALKGANFTWDRTTLDRWIEKPSAVVPGNAMAFAGLANPTDRAALIAYVEAETRASP